MRTLPPRDGRAQRAPTESAWSRLWFYNKTTWSFRHAATVVVCALLLPPILLLALGPMLLICIPIAMVLLPLLLPTLFQGAFLGSRGRRRRGLARAERIVARHHVRVGFAAAASPAT